MGNIGIFRSTTRVALVLPFVLFTLSCSSDENPDTDYDYDEDYDSGTFNTRDSGNSPRQADADTIRPTDDGVSTTDGVLPLCAEADVYASRVIPTIVLLVDGSGTMDDDFRETTDPRWRVLREALMDKKNGAVKPVEEILEIGLSIFSGSTGDECPFESKYARIEPAKNNFEAMDDAYPINRRAGTSFTATSYALEKVCSELLSKADALAQGKGEQYIILATDGNPNGCPGVDFEEDNLYPPNNFSAAEKAAQYCADKGITIFMLSLADEVDQAHMQTMANIGAGTNSATVYQPSDPAALTVDLKNLIKGTISCQIKLDITQRDTKSVIDDQLLQCEQNGGSVSIYFPDTKQTKEIPCGQSGWIMTDSEHIELQGQVCEDFKNNPGSRLTAEFPCDSIVVL